MRNGRNMARHGANEQRNGGGAWRVVFVIALIVLIASLAILGVVAFSYLQGQWMYGDVAKEAGLDTDDLEGGKLDVSVDWDALLAANPETVAWVYMPGTNINYPVVQHSDNDYYLTHDFDGQAGWLANYGAVFLDYRNNPNWTDELYFLYGHHMNDGSMFADLAGLTDQARFDECRTIYVLSPTGNFKLRTFAMCHLSADASIVQSNFATTEDMVEYMQDKIDQSVTDPGKIVDAQQMSKVFALATCDNLYSDGRYILYAYVEQTTAEGLSGTLGLQEEDGQTVGFANDLEMKE